MGRIRTVKPEFFTHEGLYDAEIESSLPLRLAFAGLWTQADREGRFKWEPRRLKAAILPYDDVDFSRVLDALTTRGWLVKYACPDRFPGVEFGAIPTFARHQVINNRERASEYPSFDESGCVDSTSTRAPRVNDACPTPLVHARVEGNGREQGKEQEKEEASGEPLDPPASKPAKKKNIYSAEFEAFWAVYPLKAEKAECAKAYRKAVQTLKSSLREEREYPVRFLLERASMFAKSKTGQGQYCPYPATWLNKGRYDDDPTAWGEARSVDRVAKIPEVGEDGIEYVYSPETGEIVKPMR